MRISTVDDDQADQQHQLADPGMAKTSYLALAVIRRRKSSYRPMHLVLPAAFGSMVK